MAKAAKTRVMPIIARDNSLLLTGWFELYCGGSYKVLGSRKTPLHYIF
jgi:hypothetical protein